MRPVGASRSATGVRKGDALALLLLDLGSYPDPDFEYVFAKAIKRRWRFDLAWPEKMIAIEIDGGTWTGGRHVSGIGHEKDCEKMNEAAAMGWKVFRFTPTMIRRGDVLPLLGRVL